MILVDSRERLERLVQVLGAASAIGVDTEADSFFRYREKTCLLQISSGDEDYLVDPLGLADLTSLAPVFANPAVLKVFHAADNDVANLKRDCGLETRHLFDTHAAARILGLPRVGLGDLLREYFQVETDKRLQRYNWNERPLAEAALRYAALDSHYLVPLSRLLKAKLRQTERWAEAEEEFSRLEDSSATPRVFDPESFWRIKGAYDLEPRQRAILRELNAWRNGLAEGADRPPFRVLQDGALVALARAQPRGRRELEQGEGLHPNLARRYAAGLLAAIERGAEAPIPVPHLSRRPGDAVLDRYEALRRWRRKAGAERGVEPDVIVSNAVLNALAASAPRSDSELGALNLLGPWKLGAYGTAMLQVLRSI